MIRLVFIIHLFFILNLANAQQNIECQTKLSNFHMLCKSKSYDQAYEDWLYVKTNCPDLSLAIYADGENILEHKIETALDSEKTILINSLIALWEDRAKYFQTKTPTGEFGAKSCQLQFNHKKLLGKTDEALFSCFKTAFDKDNTTFTHPKSLYTYFSLAVALFDDGKMSAPDLFSTYDAINEKIELEIQNYSEKLNEVVSKIQMGSKLSSRELRNRKAFESYLKNYALINDNMAVIINKKANCDNLIPLYIKEFENNKSDSIWLKRSVSRMYHKDCVEDALYEKLVIQYDKVAPSADTKLYVATVLLKNGKDQEAYTYLKEAYDLEKRPYKKANIGFRIGVILKKKNQFIQARTYFLNALELNPSNGKPHVLIAQMYNESAKNKACGKDNFHQRAVYWLAAEEVKKASRIDPTLQKIVNQMVANYIAKAPTKEEVFLKNMGGKLLEIKCWINRAVRVPKP